MIYWIVSIDYGERVEIMHSDGTRLEKDMNALRFINEWCMLYGSTYEGRKNACARHMHILQKIPILISERTLDMVFPIRNIRNRENMWINYRAVDTYVRCEKYTSITFLNGESKIVPADIRSVRREMRLCDAYLQILEASPR